MDKETIAVLVREAARRSADIGAKLSEVCMTFQPSQFSKTGHDDLARAAEDAVEAYRLASRATAAFASDDLDVAKGLFSEAWDLCYNVAEKPLFEEGRGRLKAVLTMR